MNAPATSSCGFLLTKACPRLFDVALESRVDLRHRTHAPPEFISPLSIADDGAAMLESLILASDVRFSGYFSGFVKLFLEFGDLLIRPLELPSGSALVGVSC